VTWFKHVPVGNGLAFEVRTAPGNTWNENGYDIDADDDSDVLMVEDTSRIDIILGQARHPWVDVAASDFKDAMRRRYP